jgi:hypothetical protein
VYDALVAGNELNKGFLFLFLLQHPFLSFVAARNKMLQVSRNKRAEI